MHINTNNVIHFCECPNHPSPIACVDVISAYATYNSWALRFPDLPDPPFVFIRYLQEHKGVKCCHQSS